MVNCFVRSTVAIHSGAFAIAFLALGSQPSPSSIDRVHEVRSPARQPILRVPDVAERRLGKVKPAIIFSGSHQNSNSNLVQFLSSDHSEKNITTAID